MSNDAEDSQTGDPGVNTGGGAFVGGHVRAGRDFIGRDKLEVHVHIHQPLDTIQSLLRSVFDPLFDDARRLFIGRQPEMVAIAKWLEDTDSGYLAVLGPPGFGKTTLITRLLDADRSAFAYHFFAQIYGPETLSEDFFLRSVVEQIAAWHGDRRPLPAGVDNLRAAYHEFLGRPLSGPQVLVLDGLDEVDAWELAPYLSRRLGPGLRVLASLRDVGQDWRREYGFPPDQLTEIHLPGIRRDELAEALIASGASGRKIAGRPELLDRLARAAAYEPRPEIGADPFYVRFLIEDAAGELDVASVGSAQPTGLGGYLDGWWARIRRHRPAKDLVGTLAAAYGPMTAPELTAVNPSLSNDPWESNSVDNVMQKISRFVRRVSGDQRPRFALAHPRLRGHLAQQSWVEPYRERLGNFCRGWQTLDSRYAVLYCAEHVAEDVVAGRVEPVALYELARSPGLRKAQRLAMPEDPAFPLRLLRRVLGIASGRADILLVAELALRHAVDASPLIILDPLVALRGGSIATARDVAALWDREHETLWLLLLAWELIDHDRPVDAENLIVELRGLMDPAVGIRAVEPSWARDLALELGSMLGLLPTGARHDSGDVFLNAQELVTRAGLEVPGVADVVRAWAEQGDLDRATRLALSFSKSDEHHRATALRYAALINAQFGSEAQALECVRQTRRRDRGEAIADQSVALKDPEHRHALRELVATMIVVDAPTLRGSPNDCVEAITQAQLEAGMLQGAAVTASLALESIADAGPAGRVIVQLESDGESAQAMALLDRATSTAPDNDYRRELNIWTLAELVQTPEACARILKALRGYRTKLSWSGRDSPRVRLLARTGSYDEARAAALKVAGFDNVIRALTEVGLVAQESGATTEVDTIAATALALLAEQDDSKPERVVQLLIALGRFRDAQRVARSVTDREEQATCTIAIAKAQHAAGLISDANRSFGVALRQVRSSSITALIKALAACDRLQRAKAVIERTRSPDAHVALAVALAGAGDWKEASREAENIDDASLRLELYGQAAVAMLARGMSVEAIAATELAKATMEGVGEMYLREEMIWRVAWLEARVGLTERSADTVASAPNRRPAAAADVVEALVMGGDPFRAMSLLHRLLEHIVWDVDAACRCVGLLAWARPDQGSELAALACEIVPHDRSGWDHIYGL